MKVKKGYQSILILLLNVIFLISKDREINIYFCAVINILFWWANRRYLKYDVEKWKLPNLSVLLLKLSTIIYFIFICGFFIDFNTVEGLLFVAVILSSEVQLFLDSTIPRWILYIYFILIFFLKFEGFVEFLIGGIGFQFLFDIFYTEEFIDYIGSGSGNENIKNKKIFDDLNEKIKNTREKIKIRMGIFTIAFVVLRYIDVSFSNDLSNWFYKNDKIFFLFILNIVKFALATGMAIGLDMFICSKNAADLINRKRAAS